MTLKFYISWCRWPVLILSFSSGHVYPEDVGGGGSASVAEDWGGGWRGWCVCWQGCSSQAYRLWHYQSYCVIVNHKDRSRRLRLCDQIPRILFLLYWLNWVLSVSERWNCWHAVFRYLYLKWDIRSREADLTLECHPCPAVKKQMWTSWNVNALFKHYVFVFSDWPRESHCCCRASIALLSREKSKEMMKL